MLSAGLGLGMSVMAALCGQSAPAQAPHQVVPQLGHGWPVQQVFFEPDGGLVTTSSGLFRRWSSEGLLLKVAPMSELEAFGKSRALVEGRRSGTPGRRGFTNPKGTRWVRVDAHGGFEVYEGNQRQFRVAANMERPVDLRFSSDDQLVVAHQNGAVRVWSLSPSTALAVSFFETLSKVQRLAVFGAGRELALVADGKLAMYDTLGRNERWIKRERSQRLHGPIDVRGARVAVASGDRWMLLDLHGLKIGEARARRGTIRDLVFDPKGERIAVIHEQGSLRLFNLKAELISEVDLDAKPIAIAFSSDGARMAVGQRDGWVTVLDRRGKVKRAFRADASLEDVDFGLGGSILSCGASGVLRWTVDAAAQLLAGPCGRVAVSRDQRRVAAISSGFVKLWEGEARASLIAQTSRWLTYDEQGRIYASDDGASLAALVGGEKARPLTALARRAWEGVPARERSRLRLDSESPLAWVSQSEQAGERLKLRIELEARTSSITAYEVRVSGTRVIHRSGALVPPGGQARAIETIVLEREPQRVQVRVEDAQGWTHPDSSIEFSYGGERKSKLFFFGFVRSGARYAKKDKSDLSRLFSLLARDNRLAFRDLSWSRLSQAKERLRKDASVDDLLVIFVSGSPQEFEQAELQDFILEAGPRRKLLLLDAAAFGQTDLQKAEDNRAMAKRRGLELRVLESASCASLFPRACELGLWVISAARFREPSFESRFDANGLFVQELINGLTSARADVDLNRKISVEELAAYLGRAVRLRSYGRQSPLLERRNPERSLEFLRTSRPWDRRRGRRGRRRRRVLGAR